MLTFEDAFELSVGEKSCLTLTLADSSSQRISQKRLSELCNQAPATFFISNLNTPTQTLIAAEKKSLKLIERYLKAQNMPFLTLSNIPQPYHCSLMDDSYRIMLKNLSSLSWEANTPKIPLMSSITQAILDLRRYNKQSADKILASQLTQKVDFITQNLKHFKITRSVILSKFPQEFFIQIWCKISWEWRR